MYKRQVLILGSIPSPKSREQGFYYGHPRNRFWPVLAALFGEEAPETVDERRSFLIRHRIALWDVLASCETVSYTHLDVYKRQVSERP